MPILSILNCNRQHSIIILGPPNRPDEHRVHHSDCDCTSNWEKIIDPIDVIDKHSFIVIFWYIHYFSQGRIFFIVSFDFFDISVQHLFCRIMRNFVHSLDDTY